MAVTLSSADSALKTYYLDAIAEQLNTKVNPFLSAIEHSTENVYGKEIRKFTTYGLNSGIGAGTEDGTLPKAGGNNYAQMVTTLKNLYGTIEISDKAIRASQNDTGAFINLLNAEMEGLVKASIYNFGRMLFGNGNGEIAMIEVINDTDIQLVSVDNVYEGMIIDFVDDQGNTIDLMRGVKITGVDRKNNCITIDRQECFNDIERYLHLVIQGSYQNEITGLGAIFGKNDNLYGLSRYQNGWLVPYNKELNGAITENEIQIVLDEIEKNSGSSVNFIVCSWGVRRALQQEFSKNRRSIDMAELAGGYKAITYNGIPIVADRFCPKGTMYLLNTEDFTLHQLCDWQWMEGEDGRILKQIPGRPVYTATLVKYADLICSRPCGQGIITNITE